MKIFEINRRACRRRGATAVEAALVLPLVLIFLFGILEYGRYIMTLQVLTNAAREGTHYALVHTQPITIGSTTYGNATSDVSNIINKALGGQTLIGQSVQIYTSDATGTSNLGTWTSTQVGQSICVQITGTYRFIIPSLLHLNSTIPIDVKCVMRSESN